MTALKGADITLYGERRYGPGIFTQIWIAGSGATLIRATTRLPDGKYTISDTYGVSKDSIGPLLATQGFTLDPYDREWT